MSIFFVAEIGINHNGDMEICKKLIDLAVQAGCNAVKFQKREVEDVYSKKFLESFRDSPWGKTQRDQKHGLELNKKDYDVINEYCIKNKIEWFASAWDLTSLKFLDQYKAEEEAFPTDDVMRFEEHDEKEYKRHLKKFFKGNNEDHT